MLALLKNFLVLYERHVKALELIAYNIDRKSFH